MLGTQVVLRNVLPFLRDRGDWNSVSAASKSIHQAYREETRDDCLTPPWPLECRWPADPSLPEDVVPAGFPRSLGKRAAGEYDSFRPVWSRDGRQVASISNGHWLSRRRMMIHVVDQRAGHVKRWEGHGGSVVKCLDYGDDFLISSGYDRRVRKWDREGYECVGDWDHLIPKGGGTFAGTHLQEAPLRLKVSPDSRTVVILLKGSLRIFGSSDGDLRHSVSIGDNVYGTSSPIFTPDGSSIIFGCANSYGEEGEEPTSDGFIKVYSFDSENISTVEVRREVRRELVDYFEEEIEEFASDLALLPDGKTLVSSGTELLLWNVVEGRQLEFRFKFDLPEDERYSANALHSVALTPCNRYVAVAGGQKFEENWGFLQFSRIDDGKIAAIHTFVDSAGSVRYSSKGNCLYTINNKTTINPAADKDNFLSPRDDVDKRRMKEVEEQQCTEETDSQSAGEFQIGEERQDCLVAPWTEYVRSLEKNYS